MSDSYQELVAQLRTSFPAPVSDRMHDAYFVFSILRALDQVDALKSAAPMLGTPVELDYDAARRERMSRDPRTLEAVTADLVHYLSGMFIWGHPRAQINVVPSPTIPSIIGGLLPSIYNPNLVSEESSRQVSLAEVEAIAMTAALVGYDPAAADGVFTFGGTGTMLYAAKIGLEKAVPGVRRDGLRTPAVLVCSERAHYACLTVANWLGLGESNVVMLPSTDDNQMQVEHLAPLPARRREQRAPHRLHRRDDGHDRRLRPRRPGRDRARPRRGRARSAARLLAAHPCRRRHRLGLERLQRLRLRAEPARLPAPHAARARRHDPAHPPPRARRLGRRRLPQDRLHALHLERGAAARQARLLDLTRRDEDTPYIFQSGERHPGKYTLETSRSGSGPLSALANLRLFGTRGLQALLGHVVGMAEELREQLEGHAATTVMNGDNFGPVTLFRVYPDGVDTFSMPDQERRDPAMRDTLRAHNDYNRRIFEIIQAEALQGQGVVISLTDCYRESDYGEPINALKSYILSPFSDVQHVHAVLESIWKARREISQT